MALKQSWYCDVCGKKKNSDGFPEDWYRVHIKKGFLLGDNQELDIDCCSLKCVKEALRRFLNDFTN